jgi:hypothetical protein
MTSKTSTNYVAALRARREAQGLLRFELYAHPGDWAALKELAARLQAQRDQPRRSAP